MCLRVVIFSILFFVFSFPQKNVFAQESPWITVVKIPEGSQFPMRPSATVFDNTIMVAGDTGNIYLYNMLRSQWVQNERSQSQFPNINPKLITLQNGIILSVGSLGLVDGVYVPAQLYNPKNQTWESTGSMIDPVRNNHTATLLQNGQVLVTGGYGGSVLANAYHLASSTVYNPQTNTWEQTGSLRDNRSSHTSTLLKDGSVLVVGGRGNGFSDSGIDFTRPYGLASVERFDPKKGEWRLASPLNQARVGHTATILANGNVLVTGGTQFDSSSTIQRARALSSVEIYDPQTNTWRYSTNMHTKRAGHTATALADGRVLVVGGFTGEMGSVADFTTLASAEIYDPATEQWLVVASLHEARGEHAAVVLDTGQVFVVGGITYPTNQFGEMVPATLVTSVELFTPDSGSSLETTVQPFLDVPFDYVGNNQSIEEAIFNPSSWFDHSYPLQNVACCTPLITKFNSVASKEFGYYQSHSGYDYALANGVTFGTPVLAAAEGKAHYIPTAKSGGGGNVIKIDHGNGYQTWYEHLDNEGLLVAKEGEYVWVDRGEQIGKVGMTGNTNGPHIHFSVFMDENMNGRFDDDYPYGLVDPLGWEGELGKDPWTLYTSNGRHGAVSVPLFKHIPLTQTVLIPQSGKDIPVGKHASIHIPEGMVPQFYSLSTKLSDYASHNNLVSAAPSFFVTAKDTLGEAITQFMNPVSVLFHYTKASIANIKENTLQVFYYNESSLKWEALPSRVDTNERNVRAQTTHFSHFALMGEKKDSEAPKTTVSVQGEKGAEGWYRSPITVVLSPSDTGGLGVSSTFYSINNGAFQLYQDPFVLDNDGGYSIRYFSIDKADNKEVQNQLVLHKDSVVPEAKIAYVPEKSDLRVFGLDDSGTSEIRVQQEKGNVFLYMISDLAGNTLRIEAKKIRGRQEVSLSLQALQYNDQSYISLPTNIYLSVFMLDKSGVLARLKQQYMQREQAIVQTNYNAASNTTELRMLQERQKVIQPGLKLMYLQTNKGEITYTY